MKTTRLIAAAAIAMLALASCGSGDDDTATGAPTTDTSAPQEDTGAADADDSDTDADAPATDTDAPDAGATDSGESDAGETDSDNDATVIGGDLDAQSVAWFTTFCTGMAPFAEADNFLGSDDETSTLAQQQEKTVDGLNSIADAMVDTAAQLKGMPGPTMEGGQEMADSMVTGLADSAPAIHQSAEALAAVDSSDEQALEQQIGLAGLSVFGAIAGSGISQFQLDPELQAGLAAIPECAPFADLGGMVTGG